MARVYTKNVAIDTTAVTDAAGGDGVTGYLYGPGHWAYAWKTAAVASGWTVTSSSTRTSGSGTTANNAADSDQWSSVFKVAYENAWIALKHTATGVSVVMQRGSAPDLWRIKVAYSGTYNLAGGGTASQVPTLAGEGTPHGSGADASPSFAAFHPGSGSYVAQAHGDSAVGDLKFVTYPTAGGASGATGCEFSIAKMTAGRTGADDTLIVCSPLVTPDYGNALNDDTASVLWARTNKGLGGEAFARVKMLAVGSIPGGAASDPATGDKVIATILVHRDTAPADQFGSILREYWFGPSSSVPRTANLSTTKDLLIIGPRACIWDGTEPA